MLQYTFIKSWSTNPVKERLYCSDCWSQLQRKLLFYATLLASWGMSLCEGPLFCCPVLGVPLPSVRQSGAFYHSNCPEGTLIMSWPSHPVRERLSCSFCWSQLQRRLLLRESFSGFGLPTCCEPSNVVLFSKNVTLWGSPVLSDRIVSLIVLLSCSAVSFQRTALLTLLKRSCLVLSGEHSYRGDFCCASVSV